MNKNPIKFQDETMVEVKTEKSKITLPILITENKNTQPLLGLDWLDKLEIGLQGNTNTNIIRHIVTDERRQKIVNEYEDLFRNNHTIKDLAIDIQLKKDTKPIQQKRRPVPIHFQKTVKKELEKLIESGHLDEADNTTENCFVSPAVITIKKDKSVKIALDSRKLNEACVKRKAAMPIMEELISKISAEITRNNGEIWMSKIDLDYAYGQAKLTVEATKHCVFSIIGGDFTGHYRFKKGIYGLSDIPTVFQEHIDKVLEFKTPVWLDDIICVTSGTIDEHAGYRASERKTELFKQEITWLGYHIDQNGVKPIKGKTEAITKTKSPKECKELKSFLGSKQHLSKFINNLFMKTDRMRRLLKKETIWEWTSEVNEDFKNLKKEITESPCLAHFDPKKENYATTDACNTGLGATLWQKEGEIFRPIAFASRFLTDCERKYAINELELLGALWGLEYFWYYVYGKRVILLTDHQALQPLLKRNRAHKQYSARLTRWLDRLSHFDVKVQYTAGKNIPLTDYLSRHPIVNTGENATENNFSGQNEAESEEEFVIIQIHGLIDFIQTNGSIKRFTERTKTKQKPTNHSAVHASVNKINILICSKTSIPLNGVNQISSAKSLDKPATTSKMDKVNGIDMHFIFKKRGHSPDTHMLWTERKRLLKPQKKTRIVGKGTDNERLQEYRPSQQVRKRIAELKIQNYNRFFSFCETLGTTPLKEFQLNNNESWITQSPDTESQTSNIRQEKCPTNATKKFRKHETVNLIRLIQTVKTNTLDDEHNERTEETIKKAKKGFALDLPMLVEETARDEKNLNANTAIERQNIEEIFYPYRTYRYHLTTRLGLLIYNDKIVIPEAMRTTYIAMLHQGHPSADMMDQSSTAFWWPGLHREIREKTTQLPSTEKNNPEILSEPNQEIQLDLAGPMKSKTPGDVYILVADDRFSKWPTAQICKNTD